MKENKSLLIVAILLALCGVYYIATLIHDGIKFQRWRKKWHTIPYHEEEGINNYNSFNEADG